MHADKTVSRHGIEHDMANASINALILNEYTKMNSPMTDEFKYRMQMVAKPNQKLIDARSVKIDRHRALLPTTLF
jgi:hypothetical protein